MKHLILPEGDFYATRHNMSLFTFIGEQALFNHVFLETEELTDNEYSGKYVFADHRHYSELVEFIFEHDFPMHLNGTEVPLCDKQAYGTCHDSPPELLVKNPDPDELPELTAKWQEDDIADLLDNPSYPEAWDED